MKVTDPYIYMCPFHPQLLSQPGCHITLSWVPCAVQEKRFDSWGPTSGALLTVPLPSQGGQNLPRFLIAFQLSQGIFYSTAGKLISSLPSPLDRVKFPWPSMDLLFSVAPCITFWPRSYPACWLAVSSHSHVSAQACDWSHVPAMQRSWGFLRTC